MSAEFNPKDKIRNDLMPKLSDPCYQSAMAEFAAPLS
jgi:hypothetical protein